MNDKKYTWLLYIIVTTILLTIVVQCYWNYKNYLLNKQNFINQVQVSLDNALDTYYADLAESNELTLIDVDTLPYKTNFKHLKHDSLFLGIKKEFKVFDKKEVSGFSQLTDSIGYTVKKGSNQISKIKVLRGKKASDSLKLIKGITSIFISIKNDTLDFTKLTPVLNAELKRKHLDINYALKHFKKDSVFNSYNSENILPDFLKTSSKSTFLKQNEHLEISYSNATSIILKQGLSSILISTFLVLAVISCLFYLLKIIKGQKQLAEVKNDLISNITHEFKTPIATIGVALESISNFKVIDDKEKTKKYVDMSSNQLTKLNIMVEKLLETATLDSETLELNKEDVELVELVETLVNRYKIQHNKSFVTNFEAKNIVIHVDAFHFENALNNILDNAVKYGGNKIYVDLFTKKNTIEILISDNGNSLNKDNRTRIFEKFYRIPKGNTHDIKGFGIGLYYTKSIIEKHEGTVQLILENNLTTFKISLPNG